MTVALVAAIMLMVHFDIHWAWTIALVIAWGFDGALRNGQIRHVLTVASNAQAARKKLFDEMKNTNFN